MRETFMVDRTVHN